MFLYSLMSGCGGGGGSSTTAASTDTGSIQLSLSAAGAGLQVAQAASQSKASSSVARLAAVPLASLAAAPAAAPTFSSTPTQIHLVLQSASGTTIVKDLALLSLGGQYITSPFSLPVGSYSITQYLVADATGKVTYATPVSAGSTAYLVKNPLPIAMSVTKDKVTTFAPEIIDTTLIAASDFGATSFSLNLVPTQLVLIAPFAYDSMAAAMAYTTADLAITNNGQTLYSGTLEAKTDTVIVPTLATDYLLTITKTGYVTQTKTIAAADMAAYASSPWDVGFVERYALVANASGGSYDKTECVKDNKTGLVWEGKTESGLRSGSNGYIQIMYDSFLASVPWNSFLYVSAVNETLLCGYSDWRLPTATELASLLKMPQIPDQPLIDMDWFPNAPLAIYRSSTSPCLDCDRWVQVSFINGAIFDDTGNWQFATRLVHSAK